MKAVDMSANYGASQLTVSGPVSLIRVEGEVDVATVPRLREATEQLAGARRTAIVDLTDVTFIDSSGLAVLVATWKVVTESGDCELLIVASRPTILQVFEITGLSEVLTVCPTLEEALARAGVGAGDARTPIISG